MRDTRWLESIGLLRGRSFAFTDVSPYEPTPNWEAELVSRFVTRSNAASPTPLALTSYSLTPSNTTVTEGDTSITFTITRSGDKPAQTIYASTLFDTASAPGDYDGLVNLAVNFSSGQTSRTFTVGINEDSLVEATEHFRVMIGDDPNDGSAQALDISDVFITDDDAPVGTTYSLTPSNTTVTEGNTSITFTITRSGDKPAETIYASTLFDTASSPGDYDGLVNHSVSFSSGETSETFTVSINEDSVVEATEHFRVMIGDDLGDQSAQALDISDVFITDDDAPAGTTYSLTPASTTVTEGNTSITFTITRTGNLAADTIYASTLFDTASSPGDYDGLVNFVVPFAENDPSETFTVSINDDNLAEATEHFRVMIGDDTSDQSAQALDISDVLITDNDGSTPETIFTITPASTSVIEGSQLVFTITRSGSNLSDQTVFFSTWKDTATFEAGDYRLSTGGEPLNVPIHFIGTDPTETVTLSILQDNQPDAGERFRAIVQGNPPPSDPAVNLAQTGFITINEGSTQDTLYTLTPSDSSVFEGTQVTFTIRRSGTDLREETVYFSTLKDGSATFSEGDYETLSGGRPENIPVHFPLGEDEQTVRLRILDEDVEDGPEHFRAIVQRDDGGPATPFLDRSSYVTIFDIPAAPADDQGFSFFNTVVQGAESVRYVEGLRYPVASGVVTDIRFDSDNWYTARDFGSTFISRTLSGHEGHTHSHLGEDWNREGGENGQNVFPIFVGTVAKILRNDSGFGNVVVVQHPLPDGRIIYSLYAHLESIASGLIEGQGVVSNSSIGIVGMSGPSGTPQHLHFEVFSIAGQATLSDYLVAKLFDGMVGNTEAPNGATVNDAMITNEDTYANDSGFTWYNPSLFIDENDDFLIVINSEDNETVNVFSRINDAVVQFADSTWEVVSSWYDKLKVIGRDVVDKINIGPLDGTAIEHNTVYFDGGGGDDILSGAFADRRIVAEGGIGDDSFMGGLENDIFDGGEGNDLLDGGFGADNLSGGLGDDLHFVDNGADVVLELAGEGFDRVFASVDWALTAGSHVEMLTTTDNLATASISLTGNELAQYLYGNAGSNQLDGYGGGDVMAGFEGDDFYIVRAAGDRTVEAAGGGSDRVFAMTSFALEAGSHVELLTTIDNLAAAHISLTGNELAQYLYGNAGSNQLDGYGGGDVMVGLGGDDFYIIRAVGDRAVEASGGGTDRVFATVSFALEAGSHVELLTTIDNLATAHISLTGNELAQYLYGNAGSNQLDGRGGGDVMTGLEGDDFYIVRAAGDRAVEAAGGGSDRVFATVDFALEAGSHVELLTTIDNSAATHISLTGNELAQYLYGNAGSNQLDGRGGGDVMTGFGGDDFYIIRAAGDRAVEAGGGGSDRIFAAVSFALEAGSHVEMLTTIDSLAATQISFAGNEFEQYLYGNAGANVLDGRGGADVMTGFGGADGFAFTSALGGGNVDRIADFASGSDRIWLEDSVFAGLAGGLNPNAFVLGSAAADASDRIVYNQATGQLFFDADGSGAGAAVHFATLDNHTALSASDFVVI